MKITVRDIPEEGLEISEAFDPRGMELELRDRVTYQSPLAVKGAATRMDTKVHVWGEARAEVRWWCSRCLEEFNRPFRQKFDLYYFEQSLDSVIDTAASIREEVLLAYPMQSFCRDDCKGLCPRCGLNRNRGKCRCMDTRQNPFGKLKDLL
ncbi:MAG: DUF177 domain-containing protein [Candidatus Omnitrophica bacterium]|nr:DUF177 domain-containing protein [Candidatus Omnitrophota bacterium]